MNTLLQELHLVDGACPGLALPELADRLQGHSEDVDLCGCAPGGWGGAARPGGARLVAGRAGIFSIARGRGLGLSHSGTPSPSLPLTPTPRPPPAPPPLCSVWAFVDAPGGRGTAAVLLVAQGLGAAVCEAAPVAFDLPGAAWSVLRQRAAPGAAYVPAASAAAQVGRLRCGGQRRHGNRTQRRRRGLHSASALCRPPLLTPGPPTHPPSPPCPATSAPCAPPRGWRPS
jgi:hypothetical protein